MNAKLQYSIIFRRYRKLPDGRVLDARKYGIRAWPIKIPIGKRQRTH